MALLIIVLEREELGPEVNLKSLIHPSPLWRLPLSVPNHRRCQVGAEFSSVFSPLLSRTNPIVHHIETP